MDVKISEEVKEELLDQVETRRPKEPTNKYYYYLVVAVGALFSLFYWYTCGFGSFSSESHRGVYLIFSTVLVFLMFRATLRSKKENPTVMDIIWSVVTIVVIVIWMKTFPNYAMRRVGNPDLIHLIIGALVILISLEAGRRATGYILPALALFFLLYAYFGPYIPGMLGHYGFPIGRIFEFIGFGMNGIWGVVVNTYASYVFPFIIFASFLGASGGGKAIEKIAVAIAGGSRGGPAKIAVVSSALIGSVTGSSAANAVMTGSYTIPIMKKQGYRAETAAGIEAAASTGGQFMPPIMGAGAFLIASFTQTPYMDIVKISIIPAILYFFGVGMMVHFIACRRGIKGMPKSELPPVKETLLKEGHLLLPIVLIFVMIVVGFSPQLAAFWSIVACIVLSFFKKEDRITPKRFLMALYDAAKTSLAVAATAGSIGIIVGVVSMTGLGVKFSAFIISLSGGLLPLTILFIAIGGYIIGMGVTVTATYILLAVMAVPALANLGVGLVAAHLLVFWYCNIGGVTPPVCLVAFAASSIAGCKPMDAGWASLKLSSPLFIIPLLFVYTPILFTGSLVSVVITIIASFIGIAAFSGMMQGYWFKFAPVWVRVVLGIGAVLMFIPSIYSHIAGLILLIVVSIINNKIHTGDIATQVW